MKLSDVSIKRPVFATVMSLVIVLLGVISFSRLPVREYPNIDPPVVSVYTFYRGASPSVVETEITEILEEEFSTLEGVKSMSSSSQEQGSVITIEFELNRDVDQAANDVRDRISRVRGQLPREADDPIVEKVDTNAQPIVWLGLTSDRHSTLELSDLADRVLKDRLQRLPGVGSVFLGGERRYAMRVWLDPQRLAARGLSAADVERALSAENAEIPGGRIEGTEREFAVQTRGDLVAPEAFGAIVVARHGDDIVRLSDVAQVEVGPEDDRSVTRYDGQPAVGLGVVKQGKASTLEVARAVREAMPSLRQQLAPGMKLEIAYDSSEFISDSIREVKSTLLLAGALVVLVILVFLKSMRATVIPVLAIPISIVGTATVALALGFTVNILTLLALVLAIGLVVDDAIIVLENVYRHMEMGKPRRKATFDAAKEIGFAIISTTISLVAVFVPLSFLTGTVGRLFREFGITVAVAVLISGFVALTMTPMLCSKILQPLIGRRGSWAERSFEAFFNGLNNFYRNILQWALRHRAIVVVSAVVMIGVAFFTYRLLPRELVPTEDRNIGFGIVIAPEGSTLQYTDSYMKQVEARLLALPEREALFSAVGLGFNGPGRVTDGFLFLKLKPRSERAKSQQQIVRELFPQLMAIPGVLAFVIDPPSLGSESSFNPVEYVLEGESYDQLGQAVGIMMGKAQQLGYLVNLDTDLRLNKPQLDVNIDRERAAQLGVSVTDIGSALESFLGGRVVGNFKRGSKQYDVIVQMRARNRSTPDVIPEIWLRGKGGMVQLANVVRVRETVAPKELNHYNRVRAATITASLAPGVDLGAALDALDNIWRNDLPGGVKRDLKGQSREYRESQGSLNLLFGLAVVFIFLVLAAQFESFVHPFTILLSVPLAVVGALIALFLTKQSLNIYSQIGLIMLIGLVTKNAILIVEYGNQRRARGESIHDAIVNAAAIRLRPILMTSLATVFGILPIALGLGAGGESRRPLGVAVVGGLLASTFLTLVLVPVVYSLLARFTQAHVEEEEEAEEVPARIPAQPVEVAAASHAGTRS